MQQLEPLTELEKLKREQSAAVSRLQYLKNEEERLKDIKKDIKILTAEIDKRNKEIAKHELPEREQNNDRNADI